MKERKCERTKAGENRATQNTKKYVNKILDVEEDIKQNTTDNQYKTIMESWMELYIISKLPFLNQNQELYQFDCLFQVLN